MPVTSPPPASATADPPVAVRRWSLGDVACTIAGAFALTVLVWFALVGVGGLIGVDLLEVAVAPRAGGYAGDLVAALAPVVAVWWFLGRRGSRRRGPQLGVGRPHTSRGVVAAGALCVLLVIVKGALALSIATGTAAIAVVTGSAYPGGPAFARSDLVLALLVLGPVTAVSEELLYRGVFQTALADRIGAPLGVLAGAAVFTLTHPVQAWASVFAGGLLLGWLYHRSRSLWPGIAVHTTFNGTSVLIAAAYTV